MFWKYNSPSSVQIDALLQQENVSLQDLMDEEELLQECISQNKKVIDYLTQPDTLEALVTFLVTDPSPDRELKVRFKYANLASELLTSDVPAIVDKVASSTNLLQMLYKFLEKEKPLNPLLASFVSKVFGMLVQRRSEQNWYSYQFTCFQVLDFLKSQGDFVGVAVRHIGTSAIMDLLIKLICGVDDDDQEIKQGIHQWLNDCHLIEQLIDKLAPDCDSEEHSSVDQLLCELVAKGQDPATGGSDSQPNGSHSRLLITLESKEIINRLMDILLHEERNESSVSHVINILLTLLSCNGSHKQLNLHHTNSLDIIDAELESRSSVLRTIVARLPDLLKILKQPTKLGQLVTAFGMEVERLGSTRLKVVNLVVSLIATQDSYVHTQMASLCTLQLLFELFFKFSLNNFLHAQVTQCISCILSRCWGSETTEGGAKEIDGLNNNPQKLENGEEVNEDEKDSKEEDEKKETTYHPLLEQLFNECNIIQKILDCYSSEEEFAKEKRNHNLIGYMGHIREIANNIVHYSKEGPCSRLIQEHMKKLSNDVITQWDEFALIDLAEINLKNKVIPLQMPGVTHRDSEDDSEEEFYSVESVVIMNKGFKEEDMDALGDMRFVDDFKEAEDSFTSGAQRLSSGQVTGVACSQEINIDDNAEGSLAKFEEMCEERKVDISQFDAMWKDKEKKLSFQGCANSEAQRLSSEEVGVACSQIDDNTEGSLEKFDEMCEEIKVDVSQFNAMWKDKEKKITFKDSTKSEEENHHSSSEEEGDIDDEFDSIRTGEKKMDVEELNWSEFFEWRDKCANMDSSFNPWQSAPASETTESNSWADFGARLLGSSSESFAQLSSQLSANFEGFLPQHPSSSSSQAPNFNADSSVFFNPNKDVAMEVPAEEEDNPGPPAAPEEADVMQSDSASEPKSIQDVCDGHQLISNTQQNVVFSEEMESSETVQTNITEGTSISEISPLPEVGEKSFESPHTEGKSSLLTEQLSREAVSLETSRSPEEISLKLPETDTEMEPLETPSNVEPPVTVENTMEGSDEAKEEPTAACMQEENTSGFKDDSMED